MRKFALVGAFGLGLAACLSACNPADISGNITSYEQDVEAGVKALCGVDPVATDILALFGLETVASAAEELSASIQELSRQVVQSSAIAGQAVTEAVRARDEQRDAD